MVEHDNNIEANVIVNIITNIKPVLSLYSFKLIKLQKYTKRLQKYTNYKTQYSTQKYIVQYR